MSDDDAHSTFGTRLGEEGETSPHLQANSEAIPMLSAESASSVSPSFSSSSRDLPLHRGVVCDDCRVNIRGIRWRCMFCINFDLCDTCHSAARNIKSHRPDQHMTLQLPQTEKKITFNTVLFQANAPADTIIQSLCSSKRQSCFPMVYPYSSDRFEKLLSGAEFAAGVERINLIYQNASMWRLLSMAAPISHILTFVVLPIIVALTIHSDRWIPLIFFIATLCASIILIVLIRRSIAELWTKLIPAIKVENDRCKENARQQTLLTRKPHVSLIWSLDHDNGIPFITFLVSPVSSVWSFETELMRLAILDSPTVPLTEVELQSGTDPLTVLAVIPLHTTYQTEYPDEPKYDRVEWGTTRAPVALSYLIDGQEFEVSMVRINRRRRLAGQPYQRTVKWTRSGAYFLFGFVMGSLNHPSNDLLLVYLLLAILVVLLFIWHKVSLYLQNQAKTRAMREAMEFETEYYRNRMEQRMVDHDGDDREDAPDHGLNVPLQQRRSVAPSDYSIHIDDTPAAVGVSTQHLEFEGIISNGVSNMPDSRLRFTIHRLIPHQDDAAGAFDVEGEVAVLDTTERSQFRGTWLMPPQQQSMALSTQAIPASRHELRWFRWEIYEVTASAVTLQALVFEGCIGPNVDCLTGTVIRSPNVLQPSLAVPFTPRSFHLWSTDRTSTRTRQYQKSPSLIWSFEPHMKNSSAGGITISIPTRLLEVARVPWISNAAKELQLQRRGRTETERGVAARHTYPCSSFSSDAMQVMREPLLPF